MIDTAEHRGWLLVFEAGDQVLEGILRFAAEADVRACHVSGIGAFSDATIAFFDRDSRSYKNIPVAEQVEVLALLGNITLGPEAEWRSHLHVTLARRDGSVLGGHFVDATVRPTLEVFVRETAAVIRRTPDPESGLALIQLPDRA
jgi:predicted DNA-binding protein with PD1-like motif